MKLLHSALRFRVNYFSDLGRHQVVVWMPGDTPPVDAQVDVGPKIEHEVPNEVFRSDIAPLKLGRFYPSQLLHADDAPAPMFRVTKLNEASFVANFSHPLQGRIFSIDSGKSDVSTEPVGKVEQLLEWSGMETQMQTPTDFEGPDAFRREDEFPDTEFYALARKVTHVDAVCARRIQALYRTVLPENARVLDLMAGWRSHLPDTVQSAVGLGLNEEELADNPQLAERIVKDINADPTTAIRRRQLRRRGVHGVVRIPDAAAQDRRRSQAGLEAGRHVRGDAVAPLFPAQGHQAVDATAPDGAHGLGGYADQAGRLQEGGNLRRARPQAPQGRPLCRQAAGVRPPVCHLGCGVDCNYYDPTTWETTMFKWLNAFKWMVAACMALSLSGCGYNTLQSSDEEIKASWAEVLNQYQRRADLVPNLVNVVKGYAAHEKDVFISVTEARARVGAIQATPELVNDEAAFQKFIAAQGELTGAISRLLLVAENYPQLKADGLFRDLQAQLEGTENRITVARNRYIDAVKSYNVTVRSFPSNLTAMMFGYKTKPSFTVENEKAIAVPPKVDFGAPAPAAPAGGN